MVLDVQGLRLWAPYKPDTNLNSRSGTNLALQP